MNFDEISLARLGQNGKNALEIGKAAEHLVCADLILCGYRAFLSDQGLPYDLMIDCDGGLIRVQVKATCKPRNMNSQGRTSRMGYSFSVRKRGKDGKGKRLSDKHCDIVALVALDVAKIAYFPVSDIGVTCQLMPPGYQFSGEYQRSRIRAIDGYPPQPLIERLLKNV